MDDATDTTSRQADPDADLEREALQAESCTLAVTLFPAPEAQSKREIRLTWDALVARIAKPRHYRTKARMPVIKLARFGDLRSDLNSLRHAANVLAVSGIEGDYDGEVLTLADAATLLADEQIHAMLYSSPRSTPDKPRWRVLCPLAHEYGPQRRREFVGRLNRILGGALAPESFPLAQAFYIGQSDEAAHYLTQQVRGLRYVDEVDEIEPLYPANGAEHGPSAAAAALNDSVLLALQQRGMVKKPIKAGAYAITCPWEAEHTDTSTDSATAYLQANFEGRTSAGFSCLHGHCQGRSLRDLRGFLGIDKKAAPAEKAVPTAAESDGLCSISVAAARLPANWIETEQQPPPFVVERLLPDQEAGSVVGPGGTMKSTLKLYESVHIILGRDLYGRRVLKPGVVLCVSKEDRASLIDYRLKRICLGLGLSDADMRTVHKNFLRLDLRGDAFMLQRVGADRIPFRSGDVSELLAAFAGEGITSAWFDTASRFCTGESNAEAAISIDAATVLADGWHCATELIHHVSQTIARSGTVDMHAGRGGTAFADNGRFARQLVRHAGEPTNPGAVAYQPPASVDATAETIIRMHVVKLTGAKYDMHAPVWVERRNDWEFVCAEGDTGARTTREDKKAEAQSARAGTDEEAVLAFVTDQLGRRKPPARFSQNGLLEVRAMIARGMSEGRLREAVARLKLAGKLIDAEIPNAPQRGQKTFLAPLGWQETLT